MTGLETVAASSISSTELSSKYLTSEEAYFCSTTIAGINMAGAEASNPTTNEKIYFRYSGFSVKYSNGS
jgi:purine nucleoside permease